MVWKMDKFIVITSLRTLITASWSWFNTVDDPNLLSICFKDEINFLALLFIFLVNKLYSATLFSMLESPFLLLRAEWRAWAFSLTCETVFLVMPQISKTLTEPSNTSSMHFWPWWFEITFWVDAMLRKSSKQMNKSSSKDKPVPIDSEFDVDVASHVLILLSSSSILMELGWETEGKLFERTWYMFAIVVTFSFVVCSFFRIVFSFLVLYLIIYIVAIDDSLIIPWFQ